MRVGGEPLKQRNLEGAELPVELMAVMKEGGTTPLTPEEQLALKQRNVSVKHPAEQWGHWVLKSKIAFDLLSHGKSFIMEANLHGLPGDGSGNFTTGQYDMFCPEERTVYEICDGDLSREKILNRKKYGYPVVYVEWLTGYSLRLCARNPEVPIWLAYHGRQNMGRSRADLELLKNPKQEIEHLWRELLHHTLAPAFKKGTLRKHEVKATVLDELAAEEGGFSRKKGGRGWKKVPGRQTLKFYSTELFGEFVGLPRFFALATYETSQVLRAFSYVGKLNIYNGGNKGLSCIFTAQGLAELKRWAEKGTFADLTAADFLGEGEEE